MQTPDPIQFPQPEWNDIFKSARELVELIDDQVDLKRLGDSAP